MCALLNVWTMLQRDTQPICHWCHMFQQLATMLVMATKCGQQAPHAPIVCFILIVCWAFKLSSVCQKCFQSWLVWKTSRELTNVFVNASLKFNQITRFFSIGPKTISTHALHTLQPNSMMQIVLQPTWRNCMQQHLARQPHQCSQNFCHQKRHPLCQRENCKFSNTSDLTHNLLSTLTTKFMALMAKQPLTALMSQSMMKEAAQCTKLSKILLGAMFA